MKFKLIVEYDANDDDYGVAEDDNSASASSHSTNTEHPHANRSFNGTLIYNVLSGMTRSSYNQYDYPLVDIPDEIMFQFMVMGIKDGDFIAYNYATDRIVVSNSARDARTYASRVNDNDEIPTWKRRHGYGMAKNNSNSTSTTMIDYHLQDDQPEYDTDREDLTFDLKDIHSDVYPKLKPYLKHKFVSEYNVFCNWYERWMKPIGPATGGFQYSTEPTVADSESYNSSGERVVIKMQCPVPRDDIQFMFKQFLDNGEVFKECRKDLRNTYVEKMRQISVDIITKCSEKTGTEWDFK